MVRNPYYWPTRTATEIGLPLDTSHNPHSANPYPKGRLARSRHQEAERKTSPTAPSATSWQEILRASTGRLAVTQRRCHRPGAFVSAVQFVSIEHPARLATTR